MIKQIKFALAMLLLLTISSCVTDDPNAVMFVVLSDLHISLDSSDSNGHLYSKSRELLTSVVADINADSRIKFVLMSGDLTKDGLLAEHEAFRSIIATVNVPVYLIPGNHDVEHPGKEGAQYMSVTEFPQYYKDYGYNQTSKSYYSADIYDDILLVGLDSTIYAPTDDIDQDYGGTLSREQLSWLDATLGANSEKKVIVMVHHNINEHIYGQATNEYLNDYYLLNSAELKTVLKKYDVSVVFSGHSHIRDIKEEDGIYDIITTSLLMYPLGYRKCMITSESIWVEGVATTIDDINGESASDYAKSQLSVYVKDMLFNILIAAPYSYPATTASFMATIGVTPMTTVFEGDEYIESLIGVPQEFMIYLQDEPPNDNATLVPF